MRFIGLETPGLALMVMLTCASSHAQDSIQWRTDYSAARHDAKVQQRPMLVVVGSEACFYCRKQDATTWLDPDVIREVNTNFIAVKLDGHREATLSSALRVQVFPTTIIAQHDGTILQYSSGYVGAAGMRGHLAKASPKVVVELKPILTPEQQAKDLLATAQQSYQSQRYADSLTACERLQQLFSHLPESQEANRVQANIHSDPLKLALAADQLAERTASMYLIVAKSLQEQGQLLEAANYFERVVKLSPSGPAAERAQAKLVSLKKSLPTTYVAGFEKPK